jgi:hypothetical protein
MNASTKKLRNRATVLADPKSAVKIPLIFSGNRLGASSACRGKAEEGPESSFLVSYSCEAAALAFFWV